MSGKRGAWDRAADLEAVQATYRAYARAGRDRLWDERRPGYARLAGELRDALLSALHRSASGTRGRVLDLGCGSGDLLHLVRAAEIRVDWVGVDLRLDAVEAAQQAFPGVEFIRASADEVPLPDASFDVVVCRLLFSSLPSSDLERAVATEIERLLVPGGWIVWLDLRYPNPTNPAVHGLSRGRLEELFPGWRAEIDTCGVLPPVARRLGRLTPAAYPLLHAIAPLRSHLVGRLRRPGTDR